METNFPFRCRMDESYQPHEALTAPLTRHRGQHQPSSNKALRPRATGGDSPSEVWPAQHELNVWSRGEPRPTSLPTWDKALEK